MYSNRKFVANHECVHLGIHIPSICAFNINFQFRLYFIRKVVAVAGFSHSNWLMNEKCKFVLNF